MADPRKHESSTESIGEIFLKLDDLEENVGTNSSIAEYSDSLSDMAVNNEQFSTEELLVHQFSHFEEISDVAKDDARICHRQDDEERAGNKASGVINEDGHGSSKIEIKIESKPRSGSLVQEKKKRGRKGKEAAASGASPVQDLPERYRAHVERAGGSDIKLIFEKRLFKSDVDPSKGRLAMPHSKIVRKDFLRETKSVQEGEEMDVNLVDGQLKERIIRMAMWKTIGAAYVLKKTWNDVVRENDLENNDEVQIWSFRVGGELRLALVVLSKSVGNGGENSQIHE